jgi:hypothetical protein
MEIIDNFLPEEQFKLIQNHLLSDSFPWFYTEILKDEPSEMFQMVHPFYYNWEWWSNYRDLVSPVLKQLNVFTPLRVKANLTFRASDNLETGYHYDYDQDKKLPKFNIALFYITTSNGPTKFENGNVCDCVENRLVLFDNTIKHTGVMATDSKRRVVINFNYIDTDGL